jgi:calpain-15
LFALADVNHEGVFSAYLYKDGEKVEMVVDNYIPCLDGIPVFSHSKTNELWVMVLEKAWAKLLGSYEAMIHGRVHETMRDLLGAPAYEHKLADEGALEILKKGYEQKYLLSAGVDADSSEESAQFQTLGLDPKYSFAVLGIYEVKKDGNVINLVHLRNPWGQLTWTGDWSEKSACWTPALQKQVGWASSCEGCNFWMSFEDFSKYFTRLQLCKYVKGYHFSSWKGESSTEADYHLFKLAVPHHGPHTFAVTQEDKRSASKESWKDYDYSPCHMVVAKCHKKALDDGVEFIGEAMSNPGERDTYLEVPELAAGTYYVFVDMRWRGFAKSEVNGSTIQNTFHINCYGSSETAFRDDRAPKYPKETVLAKIQEAKMEKGLTEDLEKPIKNLTGKKITRWDCLKAPNGYKFIVVKNEDEENTYLEECKFTAFEGAKVVGENVTNRGRGYRFAVGPGHTGFLFVQTELGGFEVTGDYSSEAKVLEREEDANVAFVW